MDNMSLSNQIEKIQQCLQCQHYLPSNILNFMAQFNAYICKRCYQTQASQIMAYKKSKPVLYPSFDHIDDHIFLGNQDAACDIKTFESTGVSAVCVCGDYLLTPFEDKFEYKKHDISDSLQQQIIHLFDATYQWARKMREQNKKVLFHCAAGVSRSASFVIAYLMRAKQLSYLQAYDLVKKKRTIIKPNSGFVKQLWQYQKQLMLEKIQKIDQK